LLPFVTVTSKVYSPGPSLNWIVAMAVAGFSTTAVLFVVRQLNRSGVPDESVVPEASSWISRDTVLAGAITTICGPTFGFGGGGSFGTASLPAAVLE